MTPRLLDFHLRLFKSPQWRRIVAARGYGSPLIDRVTDKYFARNRKEKTDDRQQATDRRK